MVSVDTSRALDRLCERNVAPPDFTVDAPAMGCERVLCRALHHGARAHIELRAVPRARHRRALECALAQWTLPVGTLRLRGAQTLFDAEHRHVAHQQD